jgi:serine/threonine protein phosphatase PrpC
LRWRWASFKTAALSSAGGREHNEDSCGYLRRGGSGCWVLADGLGGYRGGATASRLAVDAVLASFREDPRISQEVLATHLDRAHRAVMDRQKAEPDLAPMRTTVVARVASPDAAMWAHAGDSRLYRFTGKTCERTKDHSVPQRLADGDEIPEEQIRFHQDRNRLLRCLGGRLDTKAEFGELKRPPRVGDAFLLASDGFWEWVTEAEMQEDFRAAWGPQGWLKKMERRIQAKTPAGNDNYSAMGVLVRSAIRWM